MKGLLIKDVLNLRPQFRIYIIILLIWFAIALFRADYTFFSGVMVMFVVMLPINTIAYDEKAGWDKFGLTMPLSRDDIVLAKYLFMICTITAIAVITFIGNLIITRDVAESAGVMLYAMPVGLILDAVIMLLLKFGVEKGRVVFIAAMLIAFVVAMVVVTEGNPGELIAVSETVFNIILWLAGIIMTALSVMVSRNIYNRKDF